jgi:hypothetical protein
MIPCKHCRQPISEHETGALHLAGGYRGKQRCDPADSGLPYGYNAAAPDADCEKPCLGAPITPSIPYPIRIAA